MRRGVFRGEWNSRWVEYSWCTLISAFPQSSTFLFHTAQIVLIFLTHCWVIFTLLPTKIHTSLSSELLPSQYCFKGLCLPRWKKTAFIHLDVLEAPVPIPTLLVQVSLISSTTPEFLSTYCICKLSKSPLYCHKILNSTGLRIHPCNSSLPVTTFQVPCNLVTTILWAPSFNVFFF